MINVKTSIRRLTPTFIWQIMASLKKIVALNLSVPMFLLKEDEKNNKIFVIGNGPSLKDDLSKLSPDESYFCVNNFCTSPYFQVLKPKYYLFLDSYFFSENAHEDWIRQRNITFDTINNMTTWNMTIFVPSWANLKYIKSCINNKLIKITMIRVGEFNIGSKVINKFAYNSGFFGPYQVNVLIYAVYISIWLKAREIIVLGADTSFHNDVSVDQSSNQLYMDINHFNGDLVKELLMKNPCKIDPFTMFEILDTCSKTFYSHDMLYYFAKGKSCNIYNASSYSLIDSYPRVYLDER